MSKKQRNKTNNNPVPKASGNVEMVFVPSAPKRDGFSMADFRSAIKAADSVEYPSRTKLLDYYNDILIDLHLTAVIEKRQDKIKAAKFTFVTYNGEFNEAIDNLMNTSEWRQMLSDLLDARFYGFSNCWLDLSSGVLNKYTLLPRKHIIPEKGLFLKKQTDRVGVNITEGSYPLYIITAGQTNDYGKLLKAIPWVLLKRGDISDWATFNEIFAVPFRKGKYPQYDQLAQKALAEACRDAAAFGYAIIPNTTDLEFIQAQASGSVDAYERFGNFCDKQLSKGFLHSTMTLDAEGGNYKGEVHESSEEAVHASDVTFILDILNSQVLHLLEVHGFNPGKGYFTVVDQDKLCLKDRVDVDLKVAQQVEIPAEYWYEKYNIPVPKGGAKAKVAPTSNMSMQIASLTTQLAALVAENENRTMDIDIPKRGFFD